MRSALLHTAALFVALTISGCGQKGALYLPDRTRSTVPAQPAAPAATPAAPATAPAPAPATPPPSPAPPASPGAGH